MTDAGFFRGTSAEQDNRFSDKHKKLLKQMKFSEHLNLKVDTTKVDLDIMRVWVSKEITKILGMEDEVVSEFVMNQLEEKQYPDAKTMQINLTGFLNGRQARDFMGELWQLLHDASTNGSRIPSKIMEEKKQELLKTNPNLLSHYPHLRLPPPSTAPLTTVMGSANSTTDVTKRTSRFSSNDVASTSQEDAVSLINPKLERRSKSTSPQRDQKRRDERRRSPEQSRDRRRRSRSRSVTPGLAARREARRHGQDKYERRGHSRERSDAKKHHSFGSDRRESDSSSSSDCKSNGHRKKRGHHKSKRRRDNEKDSSSSSDCRSKRHRKKKRHHKSKRRRHEEEDSSSSSEEHRKKKEHRKSRKGRKMREESTSSDSSSSDSESEKLRNFALKSLRSENC